MCIIANAGSSLTKKYIVCVLPSQIAKLKEGRKEGGNQNHLWFIIGGERGHLGFLPRPDQCTPHKNQHTIMCYRINSVRVAEQFPNVWSCDVC